MNIIKEIRLARRLKKNPDEVFVTEDGLRMYYYCNGLHQITPLDGTNFNDMSEAEINDWIISVFS